MISRRTVLGGLGLGAGAALFLPLLRQIAHAEDGRLPRRFVIVVEGNCIEPITLTSPAAMAALQAQAKRSLDGKRWFYREYGHESVIEVSDGDLASARALDPLGPGAGDVDLVPHAAVVHGLSSKVSGGGHTTHHGALSCARATGGPSAITIDAHLARNADVRRDAPFDALRLGISSSSGNLSHGTCAYDRGRTAPVLLNPSLAFSSLFGSVASGASRRAFSERSELLDFAAADVRRTLDTFSGGSDERAKLEQYLTSLEAVSRRQERLEDMADTLEAVKPTDPSDNPLYSSSSKVDHLRAHFELAAAALLGGLTNVVVLASGCGGGFSINYGALSHGINRHDLHHGSGANASYREAVHDVTRMHVELIARLARTLLATPEPGTSGTMLDHTAIVYMPDNGEQHHSTASEWPMLLLGGSAMGLRTGGRTVAFPGIYAGSKGRQVSNLFNTLGYLAGEELDEFGSEGLNRIAPGPLSELMI